MSKFKLVISDQRLANSERSIIFFIFHCQLSIVHCQLSIAIHSLLNDFCNFAPPHASNLKTSRDDKF